jgi:hypothetical protein
MPQNPAESGVAYESTGLVVTRWDDGSVVDRETTAEADTNGSGMQPDAAPADAPDTESEPEAEQTESDGNAGQQSANSATPPVVAASAAYQAN